MIHQNCNFTFTKYTIIFLNIISVLCYVNCAISLRVFPGKYVMGTNENKIGLPWVILWCFKTGRFAACWNHNKTPHFSFVLSLSLQRKKNPSGILSGSIRFDKNLSNMLNGSLYNSSISLRLIKNNFSNEFNLADFINQKSW